MELNTKPLARSPRCPTCKTHSIPCPPQSRPEAKFLRHIVIPVAKGHWVHAIEIYQTAKGAYLATSGRLYTTSRTVQRAAASLLAKISRERAVQAAAQSAAAAAQTAPVPAFVSEAPAAEVSP